MRGLVNVRVIRFRANVHRIGALVGLGKDACVLAHAYERLKCLV